MNASAEIQIISRYLTGRAAPERVVSLYTVIAERFSFTANNKEARVWQKCMRFPVLLRFADAYFAFHRPQAIFRQRLLACFALLEAQPELAPLFLPAKRSVFYLLQMGWTAIKSVLKLIISYPLLWTL